MLRAELSDWRKFRASQLRARRRFRNESFIEYVSEVRERRQRHKLSDNVRLLSHPKQQSRLDNWVEYQSYHLQGFERFKNKRDRLKELDDSRRQVGDTDAAVFERAAKDVEAVQRLLESAERDLKRHKFSLQWIEQERQAMDPRYSTFIENDNYNQNAVLKTLRRTSTDDRRIRRPEASVVLGQVRILKAKPKKRNEEALKPNAPTSSLLSRTGTS